MDAGRYDGGDPMRGKGQRGIHMQDTCATRIHRQDACATRLIVGLVVLLVLVAGCASRPEGPSPDYGRYLARWSGWRRWRPGWTGPFSA